MYLFNGDTAVTNTPEVRLHLCQYTVHAYIGVYCIDMYTYICLSIYVFDIWISFNVVDIQNYVKEKPQLEYPKLFWRKEAQEHLLTSQKTLR